MTAVCLAKRGFQVIGIDPDLKKLELIRNSQAPFFEPGLDEYLREVVKSQTLTVTDDPSESQQSDMIYIAVGTPSGKGGAIDLTQIKNAAKVIGHGIRASKLHQVVVIKSTVIPGTARNVVRPIIERGSGKKFGQDFGLVSNPEFLREGKAVEDTEAPDRIVMGSDDVDAMNRLETLYKEFHGANFPPVIRTSHENAELIKYASNSMLATKISFINTVATIAEKIPNTDITTIAKGVGLDQRIGPRFLDAGLGYGGSCFPKDVEALIQLSKELNYEPQLVKATSEVNRKQATKAVAFTKTSLRSIRGKRIAILGLSFKPDTDDMREAVSIRIIRGLLREGARIVAYDPAAIPVAKEILGERIKYAQNAKDCLTDADLAIIVTEWDEFRKLTPNDFLSIMKTPWVFDGRRVYDPEQMRSAGIRFAAIGLGPQKR